MCRTQKRLSVAEEYEEEKENGGGKSLIAFSRILFSLSPSLVFIFFLLSPRLLAVMIDKPRDDRYGRNLRRRMNLLRKHRAGSLATVVLHYLIVCFCFAHVAHCQLRVAHGLGCG